MGQAGIVWGGEGFAAVDYYVEIWYFFLAQAVRQSTSDTPDWLVELGEKWHEEATVNKGGFVLNHLKEFVTSYDRRDKVVEIAVVAEHSLRTYGEELTREWLIEHKISGIESWLSGVQVEPILDVAKQFKQVLNDGRLPTDEQ